MENNIHIELTALQEELLKLKTAVDYVEGAKVTVEAANAIIGNTRNLQEKYAKLSYEVEKLVQEVGKVDFPIRFDKIAALISNVNESIKHVHSKIEIAENSVLTEVKGSISSMLLDFQSRNANILTILDVHSLNLNQIKKHIELISNKIEEIDAKHSKELIIVKVGVYVIVVLLILVGLKVIL